MEEWRQQWLHTLGKWELLAGGFFLGVSVMEAIAGVSWHWIGVTPVCAVYLIYAGWIHSAGKDTLLWSMWKHTSHHEETTP